MSGNPDAFLSYTRIDDEFFGGAITSLRKFLEQGVQVVTGNPFKILQDVDGIELGQDWKKRLDQAITNARFLIPILTPCFFQSDACRSELSKFIAHEESLRRDDLILPIYYVTTPLLEKPDLLKDDSLASEICARQRYDWRQRADLPINDPQIRKAVRELAEKISKALSRTSAVSPILPRDEVIRESALEHASEVIKSEEIQDDIKKGRKRILWVDDRPDNNSYERNAMGAYNIDFDLALSTGEALAKIRKSRFDAIINDMGRPPDPRAGYTLLEALRASGDLTPFLIYTGWNGPQQRSEALSRGAQGSTNNSAVLITDVLNSVGLVHEKRAKSAISAIVTGNDQHVGFRAMVMKQAIEYNLAGSAKNERNDIVTFTLQGDTYRLDVAMRAIREGTKKSSKIVVNIAPVSVNPTLNTFTIIDWTSTSRNITTPYTLVFQLRLKDKIISKSEAKDVWHEILRTTLKRNDLKKLDDD
jgi:acylphosphatase